MASTGGTRLKVLCFSWLQTLWRATASYTGLCFCSSAAGGGADGYRQVTRAQVIVESWGLLSIVGSERDESSVVLNALGSDWYRNDGKIINLALTFFLAMWKKQSHTQHEAHPLVCGFFKREAKAEISCLLLVLIILFDSTHMEYNFPQSWKTKFCHYLRTL